MARGIIYIMTTAVPGLIKIGKTGSESYKSRMYSLEHNGYRNVTALQRAFAIEVEDYDEKECMLHTIFEKSQVADTELFALDVNIAIQLLSSFDGEIIYPEAKKEEVFKEATEDVANNKIIEDVTIDDSRILPNGVYSMNVMLKKTKTNVMAKMEVKNGEFILKAGSSIAPENERYDNLKHLFDNLKTRQGVLLEDVVCASVSNAAILVKGKNSDGWKCWKDVNGNLIDIYRKKDI